MIILMKLILSLLYHDNKRMFTLYVTDSSVSQQRPLPPTDLQIYIHVIQAETGAPHPFA